MKILATLIAALVLMQSTVRAEGDYFDSVSCSNIVEIGEPSIAPCP